MLDQLVVVILVALKYVLPFGLVYAPFWAGWANFIVDTVDGDLLIPRGLSDSTYQLIDKAADWGTYIGMVAAAYKYKWPMRRAMYVLFALRTVGQLLFFITRDERMFFFFPNFLEPLFLVYATIVLFKKKHAPAVYRKYFWVIWTGVVLYKLQDEYITHIGNIDRSELIKRIFGL